MAKMTLDFGQEIDILNSRELRAELDRDRGMREVLTGVRYEEAFFNSGIVGPATNIFVTPQSMVAAGRMWAIMNVGTELASNVVFRIYKTGSVASITSGAARMVAVAPASATPNIAFSKGQLALRNGDQLTIFSAGTGTINSVFITAISIPAERFGELLV